MKTTSRRIVGLKEIKGGTTLSVRKGQEEELIGHIEKIWLEGSTPFSIDVKGGEKEKKHKDRGS